MRDKRNAISTKQRNLAESQIAERLLNMESFRRADHISIYLAIDGECSLQKFMAYARRSNKRFYAPVVRDESLRFALLNPDATMRLNRFGIPEPRDSSYIDARSLDLVLTPLVAFDDRGYRLGMGGGYYDRFLAQVAATKIGIVNEQLLIDKIPHTDHDITMDFVVTEAAVYDCRKERAGQ